MLSGFSWAESPRIRAGRSRYHPCSSGTLKIAWFLRLTLYAKLKNVHVHLAFIGGPLGRIQRQRLGTPGARVAPSASAKDNFVSLFLSRVDLVLPEVVG